MVEDKTWCWAAGYRSFSELIAFTGALGEMFDPSSKRRVTYAELDGLWFGVNESFDRGSDCLPKEARDRLIKAKNELGRVVLIEKTRDTEKIKSVLNNVIEALDKAERETEHK